MIQNLKAWVIFNSLGQQSLQVKVITDKGAWAASVPSGTSKGAAEARELGVKRALKIFSKIRPKFIGLDESDSEGCDTLLEKLDKTKNFSKIGGNLALAMSVAIAKAATQGQLWKLNNKGMKAQFPLPVGNIIGGGLHGGGTDWQEFLIIPTRAKTPEDACKTLIEIWKAVGEELKKKRAVTGQNLERAWMTKLNDLKTLEFISQIAEDWGARLGIDFASSGLWDGKVYKYKKLKKRLNPDKQIDFILEITKKYKLYYLEDPFHEDAFDSFSDLTTIVGKGILVVGDDLYCTNPERLRMGIRQRATNSIIIKPNQVGTLYKTREAVELARNAKIIPIPSHRSGETSDNWIADLALTFDAPLIKIGLGDMPKHNRLVQLWSEIPNVKMAGLPFS